MNNKEYPHRILVAGGRDFADYRLMEKTLDKLLFNLDSYKILIISGCAKGADTLGADYAKSRGLPVWEFPADWDGLGKRAGFVRNIQMLDVATHVVVFWDGKSKGTAHTRSEAIKRGLPTRTIKY